LEYEIAGEFLVDIKKKFGEGDKETVKVAKLKRWPGIKNDIKKYIQGCFKYQQNKMQHMKKAGELYLLKMPEEPWQEISINVIGPLSKFNKKDAIIVIVD